jgi:hypothetical protein
MNGIKTRSERYPESVPNARAGFAYFRSAIENNELNFFAPPRNELAGMTFADTGKND